MSSPQPPSPDRQLPLPARAAVSLEHDQRLDPAVDALARVTAPLGDTSTGATLRGQWLGHALHPALTDLPLGLWTSASVLDLIGGAGARPAARRLIGVGLLAAAPTAASGWAEWSRAERPAQRVGVAHAGLNVAAIVLYAASWAARRGDRHRLGAVLAATGSGAASAAAYLGGHLTTVRKVSSRHPAFDTPESDTPREVPAAAQASMGATPRPAASGTDVLAALAAQHARITTMAQQVTASVPERKAEALGDLLGYLAGHEAVEEELIHPRLAAVGGSEQGLARAQEESDMAQQILRLEQLEPGTSSFDTQFGLFIEALTRHARAEEAEELPRLLRHLTSSDASLIVDALGAHEEGAAARRGTWAVMLATARTEVRDRIDRRAAGARRATPHA